jgi:hypothetical protein
MFFLFCVAFCVFFISCIFTDEQKDVVRLFKRTGIVLRFLKERHFSMHAPFLVFWGLKFNPQPPFVAS